MNAHVLRMIGLACFLVATIQPMLPARFPLNLVALGLACEFGAAYAG